MSAPPVLHQATVFLLGRFEEGRFTSPHLPPGSQVRLGGFARRKPQYLAGEGVFSHWPRTNTAGEIISLTLVDRLKQAPPDPVVLVQGILLKVTGSILTILIEPETRKIKPSGSTSDGHPRLPGAWSSTGPTGWRGALRGCS